jgi:hypothetical protein
MFYGKMFNFYVEDTGNLDKKNKPDLDRFLGFCDGYLLVCDSSSIKYVAVPDSVFKEHESDNMEKS